MPRCYLDRRTMNNKIAAIDLFCGVGGLTRGLMDAGISVTAGIDIDETCRFAYENNNNSRFINSDITKLTGEELNQLYPADYLKILVGCAPCQPFSTHTQKYKNRKQDGKWDLLYSFSRLIKEINPDIISAENVPAITRNEVFTDFINELEKVGYHVSWEIVYCPAYGIPQSRKRMVLLASKLKPIELIKPTHSRDEYTTVRDAIGRLAPIKAGEIYPGDCLHRASNLSEINLKRIKQSKPGGTWRDWDENLRSPCHKKETGDSYGGVYARMAWDKPSPTITTEFNSYGTGRFGHPEQDRAISLREGALLQTFPIQYKFYNDKNTFPLNIIARHIGNAVPVRLGYVIGTSIIKHIQEGSYARR